MAGRRSRTSAAFAATASSRTRASAGRTPRTITAVTTPKVTPRRRHRSSGEGNHEGREGHEEKIMSALRDLRDLRGSPRDFVEVTEDLSGSPLWNPDLAPTPLARHTWSTYHIAALWIGMSVVITTYTLASGLMQQGMTWWQAMTVILLGNTIVLLPMILNAHAGTKYGISFPVLCRASFGVRGANVPAMLRALVACGWFGIQTWIGGPAPHQLLPAAHPRGGALGG